MQVIQKHIVDEEDEIKILINNKYTVAATVSRCFELGRTSFCDLLSIVSRLTSGRCNVSRVRACVARVATHAQIKSM